MANILSRRIYNLYVLDGQAIPNRLEKMIKKATKRLNDIIQTYNECEFLSRSNIANKISFMDVKDPEGPLYQILDAGIEVNNLVAQCKFFSSLPILVS